MSPDRDADGGSPQAAADDCAQLEEATRGLLELTVAVLERMNRSLGLTPLRALQSLRRRGPSLVTELANDLDMLVSTASRLSDRLTEAGLITREVSPTNRRATQLELTVAGLAALDDLVAMRTSALRAVTDHMSRDDLDALLTGARAFTVTRARLARRSAPENDPEHDGENSRPGPFAGGRRDRAEDRPTPRVSGGADPT